MPLTQVFPGNLLRPNYTDPDNPDRLVGRSEVERRKAYLDQLGEAGVKHLLIQMIKDCLQNIPSQRPTAEQLVRMLEGMKADIEGPCGELATMDAARQVKMAKALKMKKDQLAAKDQEIRQLQQQLEVHLYPTQLDLYSTAVCYMCIPIWTTFFFLVLLAIINAVDLHVQVADERHEAELHQKDEEIHTLLEQLQVKVARPREPVRLVRPKPDHLFQYMVV